MAEAQPPLSGSEQIRSLKDESAIYQAFDSYPWKKDQSFLVIDGFSMFIFFVQVNANDWSPSVWVIRYSWES